MPIALKLDPEHEITPKERKLLTALLEQYSDDDVIVGGDQYEVVLDQKAYQVSPSHSLFVVINEEKQTLKYQIINRVLGQGTSGKVFSTYQYLKYNPDTQMFERHYNRKEKAIKGVKTTRHTIETEVQTSKKLHPKIKQTIPTLETTMPSNTVSTGLIMPALGRNLHDNITGPSSSRYDMDQCMHILSQVASALSIFQEDLQKAHCDLKPPNICVDGRIIASVIDFGSSQDYTIDSEDRMVGSYGFIPPELINSGIVSRKTDIYPLGVIAAQLLGCQRTTLNIYNPQSPTMTGSIKEYELTRVPTAQQHAMKIFLQQMTHKNSDKRPAMETCNYYFQFMQNRPNPRTLLKKASKSGFDIAQLNNEEVCALQYALDILENKVVHQDEYAALKACFPDTFWHKNRFAKKVVKVLKQSTDCQTLFEKNQPDNEHSIDELTKKVSKLIEELKELEKSPGLNGQTSSLSEELQQGVLRTIKNLRKELSQIHARITELDPESAKDLAMIPKYTSLISRMLTTVNQKPILGRIMPVLQSKLDRSNEVKRYRDINTQYQRRLKRIEKHWQSPPPQSAAPSQQKAE